MNNQNQTLPEWESDLPERTAAFNAALQTLLGKYELGLAARPGFTPDGRVGADPMIISTRKAPETKPEEVKDEPSVEPETTSLSE